MDLTLLYRRIGIFYLLSRWVEEMKDVIKLTTVTKKDTEKTLSDKIPLTFILACCKFFLNQSHVQDDVRWFLFNQWKKDP